MIQFADSGPPSLLILSVPADLSFSGTAVECFAVPILKRSGGFLLNVPRGVVSEDALIDALSGEDRDSILGPSKGSMFRCMRKIVREFSRYWFEGKYPFD